MGTHVFLIVSISFVLLLYPNKALASDLCAYLRVSKFPVYLFLQSVNKTDMIDDDSNLVMLSKFAVQQRNDCESSSSMVEFGKLESCEYDEYKGAHHVFNFNHHYMNMTIGFYRLIFQVVEFEARHRLIEAVVSISDNINRKTLLYWKPLD